jgi:peptide deformylase
MATLPVVIAPDPILKTRSAPVEQVNDEIRQLVSDMFDTMYYEHGIGLAAVQVGILKRVLVADVTWREDGSQQPVPGEQHVLINPELVTDTGDKKTYREGCLSFPDQFSEVVRPSGITVRFLDLQGKQQEQTFDGLLATCIQHEIDHLNGIVFVDHISSLKRDMILRKLNKLKRAGAFDHHHDHDHVHGEHCNHG